MKRSTFLLEFSPIFSLTGSILTGSILAGSLCLATYLKPSPALTLAVTEVPNPQQENGTWVTDMAEILSDETETQLNQMITDLEARNGTETTVVTVPETAPSASR